MKGFKHKLARVLFLNLSIYMGCYVIHLDRSHADFSLDERFLNISFESNQQQNAPYLNLTELTPTEDLVINHLRLFQDLNLSIIPTVSHEKLLQEMYLKLRDTRSWKWEEMSDLPRRLTWLYPDDGCFMRAEFMTQKLKEWSYPEPMQIFAFGDLSFSTPFETINWWYHVAPIYQYSGQAYVIDPSVDYQRPLPIQEWVQRISADAKTAQFALCGAGAVSPDDPCNSIESTWDESDRQAALQFYLGNEWNNLRSILGSSPAGILGDFPPWKNSTAQTN